MFNVLHNLSIHYELSTNVAITLHTFPFLNGFLNISEVPLFKQKRVFVCDQDEEMELLIHESQHADENSERHDVEMFTPSLEKNKIMACQSMNGFIITYLVYY